MLAAPKEAPLANRDVARTPCGRVRERALSKLADIDQRIGELKPMRDALAWRAHNGDEPCATRNFQFLDELARPLGASASASTNLCD